MSHAFRNLPRYVALLALAFTAACSVDDSMGPAPRVSGAIQRQFLPNGEVMQGSLDVTPADTQYATLGLKTDKSQWYFFGPHKIYVPKEIICAPSTSGYGLAYWLQPCSVLKGKTVVSVTAKYWTDSRGYARAEFKPDMRFHPNSSNGNVQLHLMDMMGAQQSSSAVLYCQDGTNICVNESAIDAALVTNRDPATGWVWRIIRHFSGYNVWA